MDFLLKKFGQKFLYRAIFFIIALFALFYIIRASRYLMPLGNDGIAIAWPVGKFMAQSTPKEFFITLFSSFLGEDHLSPLNNLYGYICYLLSSDPAMILNITTKILYIFIVISSLIVVFTLWKDRIRLLIFFLFLGFNLSMTWRNMIYPVPFNLSILLSLWCLFFLHRVIHNKKRLDLIFFFICFFLLIFSFETAFIAIPVLSLYALLSIWNQEIPRANKVRDIFKIYLLMFICFLPYMAIHYRIYGTFLPVSRLSLVVEGSQLMYYCKMLAATMSEWFFDIGRVLFLRTPKVIVTIFPLFIVFIYLVYKFKLLSKIGVYLFVGFILQIFCILHTGRFGAGMWTFAGIIFCIIITDIIYQVINRWSKDKEYIPKAAYTFVLLAIAFFALVNEIVQPFKKADLLYGFPRKSSQAAYKAINEGADRIVIVRLPEAEELMHPMAFWMGNKIYNKEPSLWLYPEYYQLLFKNMNIEFYNNEEYQPFSYFRPFLISRPGNKEVVVFKNKNLFSRIYLDSNDRKVLRAAAIPYAPCDYFNLNFPDISKYSTKTHKLEFVLTVFSNPDAVDEILYGGNEITNWKVSGNKISFINSDLSLENNLVVKSELDQAQIELIEVSFSEDSPVIFASSDSVSKDTISLTTANTPCRFSLSSPDKDLGIYGTLDAGKLISFSTLLPRPLELTYQTFHTNPDKQIRGKIDLSNLSQEDFPLSICGPTQDCQ